MLLAGLPTFYRYGVGRVTYFLLLYCWQGYLFSIVILLAGLPTFYSYIVGRVTYFLLLYFWQGYLLAIVRTLLALLTVYGRFAKQLNELWLGSRGLYGVIPSTVLTSRRPALLRSANPR